MSVKGQQGGNKRKAVFVPDSELLEQLSSTFVTQVVDRPDVFLNAQQSTKDQILQATKGLYDYGKQYDHELRAPKAFRSLFVDGLALDQLWEELQLQNEPLLKYLEGKVRHLLKQEEFDILPPAKKQKTSHKPQDLDSEDDESLESDSIESLESEESKSEKKERSGNKDFFSYKAMEKFIAQAEREEMGDVPEVEDEEDEERAMALLYGEVSDSDVLDDEDEDNDDDDDDEGEYDEDDDDEESEDGEKPAFGANLEFMDAEERRLEQLLDQERAKDTKEKGVEPKKAKKAKKAEKQLTKKDPSKMMYSDWFGDEEEDSTDSELSIDEDLEKDLISDDDMGDEGMAGRGNIDLLDSEGGFDEFGMGEDDDELDGDEEGDDLMGAEATAKPREKLSKYELQQLRLQEKIHKLEEKNLADKSWQLRGEVKAPHRPINSLLAEDLEFENANKLAPVITEQVTLDLEAIIKYRILERLFDDPVQKNPVDKKKHDKRAEGVELDSAKSKKSLAEIYEEEWKQVLGGKSKEELSQRELEQANISALFTSVMYKLNALSNSSFTPRKTKEEAGVELKTAQPAIAVEDITPISVSDASRLAPEEIYEKKRKAPTGRTELSKEERKRHRKQKKAVHKEKEEKKQASQKDKPQELTKEKATSMLKSNKNVKFMKETDNTNYTQSTSLFRKLQEEADMSTKAKRDTTKPQRKKPQQNANNLKL